MYVHGRLLKNMDISERFLNKNAQCSQYSASISSNILCWLGFFVPKWKLLSVNQGLWKSPVTDSSKFLLHVTSVVLRFPTLAPAQANQAPQKQQMYLKTAHLLGLLGSFCPCSRKGLQLPNERQYRVIPNDLCFFLVGNRTVCQAKLVSFAVHGWKTGYCRPFCISERYQNS